MFNSAVTLSALFTAYATATQIQAEARHVASIPYNGHSPGYGGTAYGHFGTPGNEGNGLYYANSPWGNSSNAARAGWFSPYQQYSPPQIPFTPWEGYGEAVFASCQIIAGVNDNGSGVSTLLIEMAQLPHKPITVRATHTDGELMAGSTYQFRINEWGTIQDAMACDDTTIIGEEFNPLKEFDKYGRPNVYQDPGRGNLDDVTIPADHPAGVDYRWTQNQFLQNLGGKESILGKSISVNVDNGATVAQGGCCPIVQMAPPASYRAYPNPYPYFHANPSHHRGMSYNGIY